MTALAPTLQAFFTERLIRQRQASPHTLAAYRDTLRLLLVFASARKDVEPSKLDIDDLDAPLIGAFLDHLEKQRENSARTRPLDLDRAARPYLAYARGPNGPACVRIDRPSHQRCSSRHWRARQLHGERTEVAHHTDYLGYGGPPACLARRARWSTGGATLCHPVGDVTQP